MSIWAFLMIMISTIGLLFASRNYIHWFQLESYQFPGYFRTLKRNWKRAIIPCLLMTVLQVGLMFGFSWIGNDNMQYIRDILLGLSILLGGWGIRCLCKIKNAKKPLAFTARIKRLYVVSWIVLVLLQIVALLISFSFDCPEGILAWILFPIFLPLWIALSGLIAWPLEKGISELYFRDARKILDSRSDLIRIGITGSWGKTSVKFILGTLLQEKYNTLVTPASYNTPMGVTKVIRTMLEPGHRVFVAEMGARHVGDIHEMCRLVHPTYGVLTSVGPQHLDTFKTLDRIKKTKYELMDAIPEEGACFFGDDHDICRDLFISTQKEKYLAGTDAKMDDVWAENITVTSTGSDFDLCVRNEQYHCHTKLLGELNIRNIVLAASVCLKLGLTMKQIARGITKIEPVEHRLQLISRPNGITVIDDAFNSNIRGAETALKVLRDFNGRRIAVTPGMVELGSEEDKLNRQIGQIMADCVDIAILVGGKHTSPIAEGLSETGFNKENIIIVRALSEAVNWINANAKNGDVILFENDLPDNYTE